MSLSSKDINKYLIYIILFFAVFDTARNYTYLPAAFGYIKEIAVAIISFFMFRKRVNFPKGFGKWFGILLIYFLILSPLGFFNNTVHSPVQLFIYFIKYLEFFLLSFIFYNLEDIANISYKKCITIYINMALILLFVNIIGYYIPNPIVSRHINPRLAQGFYTNRITVGQPPISVYPMIISFVYLLYDSEMGNKKYIYMMCNLIGIFISVSSTGILSILVILLIYIYILFIQFRKTIKITRKKLNTYLMIFLLFGMGIYIFMSTSIFDTQKQFAAERIERVINGRLEKDVSLKLRTNRAEMVVQKMSFEQKIFGTGIYGYCNDNIRGNLENTYISLYVMYGIVGISTFILMFIKNFICIFRINKNSKNIYNNCWALILLNIVFLMHAYTLDVIGTHTLSSGYFLFYSYMIHNIQYKNFL